MVPRWEYWRGHFCSTLTIDTDVVNVLWTENNQLINYFTLWLNFTFLDIFMVTEQSRLFSSLPCAVEDFWTQFSLSTPSPVHEAVRLWHASRSLHGLSAALIWTRDTWHVTRNTWRGHPALTNPCPGSDQEEVHYKYQLTVIHGKSEYSYKGPVISLMRSAHEVNMGIRIVIITSNHQSAM